MPETTADDYTDGYLIGLVRKRLYVPDGKPPEGWQVGRDVGILRKLRKQGYTGFDLADAIEGLAQLRDSGKIDWCPRGTKVTLRAINGTGCGVRALIDLAQEAVHRQAPRRRGREEVVPKGQKPKGATPLGDVLDGVLKKLG